MSSINGTCDSNSAHALTEQYFEQLQQRRLEERRQAEHEAESRAIGQPKGLASATKIQALGQPTELNLETGVRRVSEPGKGLFIDLYV